MKTELQATGCMIAQRITTALTGLGVPYDTLSKIVYAECQAIADEAQPGDWIAMPNGQSFTCDRKIGGAK